MNDVDWSIGLVCTTVSIGVWYLSRVWKMTRRLDRKIAGHLVARGRSESRDEWLERLHRIQGMVEMSKSNSLAALGQQGISAAQQNSLNSLGGLMAPLGEQVPGTQVDSVT